MNWHGIKVTTAARTVVDLARTSSFKEGVVVADSALRKKKTTLSELNAVIGGCPRWPGLAQARQVVAFSDGRSESALESISRIAFRDLGLPPPRLQAEIWNDDVAFVGRADFLWPEHRTVAEADGLAKYENPSLAITQLNRDAALRAAGYEVVHFTWREIMLTPWQVGQAIRAAFDRGGAARR